MKIITKEKIQTFCIYALPIIWVLIVFIFLAPPDAFGKLDDYFGKGWYKVWYFILILILASIPITWITIIFSHFIALVLHKIGLLDKFYNHIPSHTFTEEYRKKVVKENYFNNLAKAIIVAMWIGFTIAAFYWFNIFKD